MSVPLAMPAKPDILDLVRKDLRAFAGYQSARSHAVEGTVWLNANESPWTNTADAEGALRRYPQPQPEALRARLAQLYGVRAEQVLIGRGSDEAIDLLVRALCRAEHDPIVIAPPVFGMYAVCARLQGAPLIEVPMRDAPASDVCDDWITDLDAMRDLAIARGAKIVFACSPGNPTGKLIPLAAIRALAQSLSGRALVVVDEAYIEYADASSATALINEFPNIAVLRTLSKLHALAGARIGCLLADATLIEVLRRCQAPYPVPQPCAELALRALEPAALAEATARVATICAERDRILSSLAQLDGVRRVYPSAGNFLLVRFDDAENTYRRLLAAGVVVRDMRATPGLGDALRITIGLPEENDAVFNALQSQGAAA